jgi:hypothetical protein
VRAPVQRSAMSALGQKRTLFTAHSISALPPKADISAPGDGSGFMSTRPSLLNIPFEGWLANLLAAAIGAVLVLWLWRFATAHRSA